MVKKSLIFGWEREPAAELFEPSAGYGHRPLFEEKAVPTTRFEAALAWTFVSALAALIAFELLVTYL